MCSHHAVLAGSISRRPVSVVASEFIDHRFFYEDLNFRGNHTFRVTHEVAARQLRSCRMANFSDWDFLRSLDDYTFIASVTGFFIEQAILSSIGSRGLDISMGISVPMDGNCNV